MGAAPPLDLPPPAEQDAVQADAGFKPSPSGASICGFGFPTFAFNFKFVLPKFPPFDFPPKFNFFLALNCDLSDPFEAKFAFGGGRQSTGEDPDVDPEFGAL
jgi:hypothetical protein